MDTDALVRICVHQCLAVVEILVLELDVVSPGVVEVGELLIGDLAFDATR